MKTIKAKQSVLEKKVARLIAVKIKIILKRQPFVVLGLAGGTSVQGIFKQLTKQKIDWRRVHIFMVDERLVSISNNNNNFKSVKSNLISSLIKKKQMKKENSHPFICKKARVKLSVQEYYKELVKYGENYNVLLLSAGEDCHIASLFPNHSSIKDNSPAFIQVKNAPKPPTQRMSASRFLISRADTAIILFFGKEKLKAYKKFLSDTTIEECPAKLVNNIKDSYLFTDLKA